MSYLLNRVKKLVLDITSYMIFLGVLILSCFHSTFHGQNLRERFNKNDTSFPYLATHDPDSTIVLLKYQESLYNKIKERHPENASLYFAKLLHSKCFVFTYRSPPMVDSLDIYSKILLLKSGEFRNVNYRAKALNHRVSYYQLSSDYRRAVSRVKKSIDFSVKTQDTIELAVAVTKFITILNGLGDFEEIDSIVLRITPYFSGFPQRLKIDWLLALHQAEKHRGNSVLGQKYNNEALDLAIRTEDSLKLIQIYLDMAITKSQMGDPESGLTYTFLARQIYQELNLNQNLHLTSIYQNLTHGFYLINNLDSAEHYATLNFQVAQQLNDSNHLLSVSQLFAHVLMERASFEQALKVLLPITQNSYQKENLNEHYINSLMRCYYELGDYQMAIQYGQLGLAKARGKKDYPFCELFNHTLAMVYEVKRDYKEALKYRKERFKYRDSIFDIEKEKELANLVSSFELKIQEQENEILQNELVKTQLINQKNEVIKKKDRRNRQYLVVIMISSILLLVLLLTYLSVRNQSKKKQIQLNQITIQQKEQAEQILTSKLKSLRIQLIEENEQVKKLEKKLKKQDSTNRYDAAVIKNIKEKGEWLQFISSFNQTYDGLIDKLKKHFPSLTNIDCRIVALIKMQLSNKEMADYLVVSYAGIKKAKSRLGKKFNLNESSELAEFIDRFIDNYC